MSYINWLLVVFVLTCLAACKRPEGSAQSLADDTSVGRPVDSSGAASGRVNGEVRRIVSLSIGTDEILCALVGETGLSRIAALSTYSVEPELSNVAETAARVGALADRNIERIISLKPDLVLAARYTKAELRQVINQSGVPIVTANDFRTISDIEANIRLIAAAIDEEERAREIIQSLHAKLHEASLRLKPEKRSLRVLYLAPGNWTAGAQTNIQEIITAAGQRNAAAEAGITGHSKIAAENLVRANPDLILIATGHQRDRDFDRRIAEDSLLSSLAAVKNGRIIKLPSRYLRTVSHHIADGVLSLVDAVNSSK